MALRDVEATELGRDLLVIALSGVQRFIAESRTTADLRAGSTIIARLSDRAATTLDQEDGVDLVFPVHPSSTPEGEGLAETAASRAEGVPNRIVALVPAGTGANLAGQAVAAVQEMWSAWVRRTIGRSVETPGMPSVHWVCVSASEHADYAAQWVAAQSALVARRRIRNFDEVFETGRRLCTQSPRWVAEDKAPRGVSARERDALSAANWVKRRWGRRHGASDDDGDWISFPSTSSIASAPFRLRVLGQLDDPAVRGHVDALCTAVRRLTRALETPVPGLIETRPGDDLARWFAGAAGAWVYPEVWHPGALAGEFGDKGQPAAGFAAQAEAGRAALDPLLKLMGRDGQSPPPSYLALVAQDLDGMGRYLGGEGQGDRRLTVTPGEHRRVSARMVELGTAQSKRLVTADLLGVPVYAGGDDLLAFTPAATALAAARACHDLVPADLPKASSAVLFFHRTSSLRRAVAEARELLSQAKSAAESRKHALGVGFLRRSGVREHSIQPWHPAPVGLPDSDWDDKTAADLFAVFAGPAGGRRLSPRLVSVLERDAHELAGKGLSESLYRAELARLVERHGGSADASQALLRLGTHERAGGQGDPALRRGAREADARGVPARAARVAAFLRQECALVAGAPS